MKKEKACGKLRRNSVFLHPPPGGAATGYGQLHCRTRLNRSVTFETLVSVWGPRNIAREAGCAEWQSAPRRAVGQEVVSADSPGGKYWAH